MPISHIGLNTPDINSLSAFYLAVLSPLGYKEKMSFMDGKVRGYGGVCEPDFWLSSLDSRPEELKKETGPLHLAFAARTRNQVRAFYDAALYVALFVLQCFKVDIHLRKAGATCNGPPGLRPQYFMTYYAAFVIDPEGRNIEAVCMKPGFWAEEWSWGVWTAVVGLTGVGVGALWNYVL